MSTATTDTAAGKLPPGWDRAPDGVPYDPLAGENPVPEIFLRLDDGAGHHKIEFGRNIASLRIVPMFNMLSDDLSGPLAYLRTKECEKKIREWEDKKTQVKNNGIGDLRCPELRELCLSAIGARTVAEPVDRKASLKAAIESFIAKDPRYARYPFHRDPIREDFKQLVRELYANQSVDADGLAADLDELLPPQKECFRSIENERKWIDEAIGDQRREIKKIWYPGFPKKFYRGGNIPSAYGPRSAPDAYQTNGSHQQNINLTMQICEDFFAIWKARARHFNEPISVNAVAIRTLPQGKYETWIHLFKVANIRPELFDDLSKLKPSKYTPYHFDTAPQGGPLR
ncbi:hypothetical protein Pan258_35190 [Symmachiella dynata]|uniref:hypothetical protein n=1 Tax=Symmachiella dynata TaxID=2527995 RepID=UPI00118A6FF1|nr:hypothetical protein [Symmachiella dynata]QDT49470.1 hypothetical protein Pan258_35190 [Symmachiella dynata]